MQRIGYLSVLSLTFLVLEAGSSFTKLGNSYMKNPDTCCSTDPANPAKNCKLTSLVATQYEQLAYSPGFPNRFPIQRECIWTVQCRERHQIRVEFRDFYLIGPDRTGSCVDQFVIVKSPLTGFQMGKFCGNSGLPTIVSASNILVISLRAEIPQSSENYRGFVFAFREAHETPNPELRPANWNNDGTFSLDYKGIANLLFKLTPTDATYPDATPKTTTLEITSRPPNIRTSTNPPGGISKALKPVTPLRKPTRPTRRPVTPFRRPITPYKRPVIPSRRPPRLDEREKSYYPGPNKDKNKKQPGLQVEIIAAIAVGGALLFAIIIIAACKLGQICRRRNKSKEISSPTGYGNNIPMSAVEPVYSADNQAFKEFPQPGQETDQAANGQYPNNGIATENPYQLYPQQPPQYMQGQPYYPPPYNPAYPGSVEMVGNPSQTAYFPNGGVFSHDSNVPGNNVPQQACHYDATTGVIINPMYIHPNTGTVVNPPNGTTTTVTQNQFGGYPVPTNGVQPYPIPPTVNPQNTQKQPMQAYSSDSKKSRGDTHQRKSGTHRSQGSSHSHSTDASNGRRKPRHASRERGSSHKGKKSNRRRKR
ncbi:uncharacterized protein LOC143452915 [Clavelina lepadiformis]|uniref:uncharacterized protein LOC143452915 n=1 Tax=Clavelina lepadiformis TaxID=159417 RepID=UPI004042E578